MGLGEGSFMLTHPFDGLVEWHRANGGKLVEFAGWEMPVRYGPGVLQGLEEGSKKSKRQHGALIVAQMSCEGKFSMTFFK